MRLLAATTEAQELIAEQEKALAIAEIDSRRANTEAHYALGALSEQESELTNLAKTADVLEEEACVALEDRRDGQVPTLI